MAHRPSMRLEDEILDLDVDVILFQHARNWREDTGILSDRQLRGRASTSSTIRRRTHRGAPSGRRSGCPARPRHCLQPADVGQRSDLDPVIEHGVVDAGVRWNGLAARGRP